MKTYLAHITLASLIVLFASCKKENVDNPYKGLDEETYTQSEAIIANPERGFYSAIEYTSPSNHVITQSRVDVARQMGRTLFLLEYYLTDFMESDISEDYLNLMKANYQALRDYGAKAIVRYAYKNGYDAADHPWDATEEWVLRHVEQLKPLFQEYSDVILVLQAGFVGAWGEWYYTDNFGMNPSSEASYQPRKHLLDALLAALPENRQIEVRTPTFKMKIYGYSLADTLTAAEAHSSTIKARIAGHNDCFLKSNDDSGTFKSTDEKKYWQAETRYTIMGGESCGTSVYCHCEDTDGTPGAITTLRNYHFTYLNLGYHPNVLSMWRKESCFDLVERCLGYRLVLKEGYFTPDPASGADYRIVLKLENVGFAAPMNPRDAFFVLCDSSGKVVKTWELDSDPRTWHTGTTTLDQTITLPEGISGEMNLYLNLPDPETNLSANPAFSIRLANEDLWQEDTGYNLIRTFAVD